VVTYLQHFPNICLHAQTKTCMFRIGILSTQLMAVLPTGFPPQRPKFQPRSGHVGFVVDKAALGQAFSEYFHFPCQVSFHQLLHIHHYQPGLEQ
jgi:hypothetical protein